MRAHAFISLHAPLAPRRPHPAPSPATSSAVPWRRGRARHGPARPRHMPRGAHGATRRAALAALSALSPATSALRSERQVCVPWGLHRSPPPRAHAAGSDSRRLSRHFSTPDGQATQGKMAAGLNQLSWPWPPLYTRCPAALHEDREQGHLSSKRDEPSTGQKTLPLARCARGTSKPLRDMFHAEHAGPYWRATGASVSMSDMFSPCRTELECQASKRRRE